MTDIYTSETLMQLFVFGPTWDGHLVSQDQRNRLVSAGLAYRWNGWNQLTDAGLEAGLAGGISAKHWHDKSWYKKASLT